MTAATEADLEFLRTCRNEGREWMKAQRRVTPAEQRRWWRSLDPAATHVYIFGFDSEHVGDHDPFSAPASMAGKIGFGMVRYERGIGWVTLAVMPKYRGNGYGTEIYERLRHKEGDPLAASIRVQNLPSIRAAERAGFRQFSVRNRWGLYFSRVEKR